MELEPNTPSFLYYNPEVATDIEPHGCQHGEFVDAGPFSRVQKHMARRVCAGVGVETDYNIVTQAVFAQQTSPTKLKMRPWSSL